MAFSCSFSFSGAMFADQKEFVSQFGLSHRIARGRVPSQKVVSW